jgi:antirestriction protein ArdC
MATPGKSVRLAPVWVQFNKGRIKAHLVQRGEKMSRVRYAETFKFPTYEAKRGEERMVWNLFISPRRE